MAVRPDTFPSQGESVVYGAGSSTGGYWYGHSHISGHGVASLNNTLCTQGPANLLNSYHKYLQTDSFFEKATGRESITIATAQPITVGFGSIVGSVPVIVNGVVMWLEVGAASVVPGIASDCLDSIAASYS